MEGAPIIKRPKATDGEEELFRMQEDFIKNNQQPSAKVINLRSSSKSLSSNTAIERPENQAITRKLRSRFSELKKLKAEDRISTSQTGGNVINPTVKENLTAGLRDSVHNIPIAPSNIILGNIVERKYDPRNYSFDKKESFRGSNRGFPEVFVSEQMVPLLFHVNKKHISVIF